MKNIDLKTIKILLSKLLRLAQRYAAFIFIVSVLLIYVFLVFRISTLSQSDPVKDEVTEKASTVKRLKIDQESINKIQQLRDQNIGVESIFKEARDNPFGN